MQKQTQILVVGFPIPKKTPKQVEYVADVNAIQCIGDIDSTVTHILLPLTGLDTNRGREISDLARLRDIPSHQILRVFKPEESIRSLIFGSESRQVGADEEIPELLEGESWQEYVLRIAPKTGDINQIVDLVQPWLVARGFKNLGRTSIKSALFDLNTIGEANYTNLKKRLKPKPQRNFTRIE